MYFSQSKRTPNPSKDESTCGDQLQHMWADGAKRTFLCIFIHPKGHQSRPRVDRVTMITYTGQQNELCPITLVPFVELKHPAVILPDHSHPFELNELIRWLKICKSNPRTNEKLKWRHSAADVVGIVKSAKNADCLFDHLESQFGIIIIVLLLSLHTMRNINANGDASGRRNLMKTINGDAIAIIIIIIFIIDIVCLFRPVLRRV